jgi:hypothetical protein
MKVKIKILLFNVLILSYCLTSSDMGNSSSSLFKYTALSVCVVYSYFDYRKKGRLGNMSQEYKGLFGFVVVVTVYSLARSILAFHFSFRTIQELLFLFLPMLYGYFVINTWIREDVDNAFKLGIIISFLCYLISLRRGLSQIVLALLASSFGNSYSELESFTFCGLAVAFCLYFCYYNKSKFFMFMSIFFVFMTFKRLFIIISIVLLVLAQFKLREKPVGRGPLRFVIVCMFIFAVTYYFVMQPDVVQKIENTYAVSVSKLTTTRSDRLRWLLNSEFSSYGFGSSTEFLYNRFSVALEMDAVKIIVELGFMPLYLFVRSYLKFSAANVYTFLFMVIMILNLTVSSGLTGAFAWSIIFISISMITIYPENTWKRKQ